MTEMWQFYIMAATIFLDLNNSYILSRINPWRSDTAAIYLERTKYASEN